MVAIGGDDTPGVANKLTKMGMKMIGVPKTIDNDLSCTITPLVLIRRATSPWSALIACTPLPHPTRAASLWSAWVVSATGWIAVQAGLAADANLILIPEFPKTFDEVMQVIRARYVKGQRHTIIAVAEGFELKGEVEENVGLDAFGNKLLLEKEIAKTLAERIEKAMRADESLDEKRKYFECRSVVSNHIQRGGSPSASTACWHAPRLQGGRACRERAVRQHGCAPAPPS